MEKQVFRSVEYSDRSYGVIGDKCKQKFYRCSIKENGKTISIGLGPTKEFARKDALLNMPKKRKINVT